MAQHSWSYIKENLIHLQPIIFRVTRHAAQPVVAQDAEHADFQHQVSRSTNSKHVTTPNSRFCLFLNSDIHDHRVALLVPADGDVCAYRG